MREVRYRRNSTPDPVVIELHPKPAIETNPVIDLLIIPLPASFILPFSGRGDTTPVVGVLLVGSPHSTTNGEVGFVSWISLSWDTATQLDLPANAVGGIFATLDHNATAGDDSLNLAPVRLNGSINGYHVLVLD